MFGEISFRPIARSDFQLLQRWLSEPHVDAWWHQPLDLAGLENKYGPRIDGLEPAHVFVIEYGRLDIGMIQWVSAIEIIRPMPRRLVQNRRRQGSISLSVKRRSSDLELGQHLSPEFIQRIVLAAGCVSSVVTDPEVENTRSIRALEKVGFVRKEVVQLKGEAMIRQVMQLDIPTETAP